MKQDTEQAITKLIEGLSKEQLIEFLVEYAERDSKLVNAINVRFGVPEYKAELAKIDRKIAHVLNGVSDWDTHDSWGHVHIDTSDIVYEVYERVEQGHIRLAFAELELLYRKMLENFEYQGECEIADKAEDCLRIMAEIAGKAALTEDKDYIFKQCIELSELEDGKDYGADYEDKLLSISSKFVTVDNLSELDVALAQYESHSWRAESFKLIRLEIIRKLQGDSHADSFIADNLEFPKIREIAYDKAINGSDFEHGAHLCLDALATYEHRFDISPWWYKLYSAYEMMADKAKMSETARNILFQGDLKYYDILKSLLTEQGVWISSYLNILEECKATLHYSSYMIILEKESEYALLLGQVEAHSDQIYLYGEFLAGKYPIKIRSIFTTQLEKEAEAARSRESYSNVCANILLFAKAGYVDESKDMISILKLKYKRKPAFVDELRKIEGKL